MPITNTREFSVQEIDKQDEKLLKGLISQNSYLHCHLDWFSPLGWLGRQPYLAIVKRQNLYAALACPPDPPQVAWIRLFVVSSSISIQKAWDILWPVGRKRLIEKRASDTVAIILLKNGIEDLFITSGFSKSHSIASLGWSSINAKWPKEKIKISIRWMQNEDLQVLRDIDQKAFSPLWRISISSLAYALKSSAIATVAEIDGDIVGYQISTRDISEGHLARLAVIPSYQRAGVGTALVQDLLSRFSFVGSCRVTVNTQDNNVASLRLYNKFGFKKDAITYPVYQLRLKDTL